MLDCSRIRRLLSRRFLQSEKIQIDNSFTTLCSLRLLKQMIVYRLLFYRTMLFIHGQKQGAVQVQPHLGWENCIFCLDVHRFGSGLGLRPQP